MHYTIGRGLMRESFNRGTFPLESVLVFNGENGHANWSNNRGIEKVSIISTEGDPETKIIGYEEANLRVQVVLREHYLMAKDLLGMR